MLAARPNDWVVINEGEKAADAATHLLPEYVTTTSSHGCKAPHKTDWTALSGRHVLIWPDADEAGRAYAEAVAVLALKAGAASVHILNIAVFGQVTQGWDAADALADGWTVEQVREIVRNPTNWLTPGLGRLQGDPEKDGTSDSGQAGGEDWDKVVEELARLNRLEYEQQREQVAKQNRIRVRALDEAVKEQRTAAKAKGTGTTQPRLRTPTQAGSLTLPTVSPCTHLANAHRIRQYYQGRIWYALGIGWVLWTSQFWRPDPTSEADLAGLKVM